MTSPFPRPVAQRSAYSTLMLFRVNSLFTLQPQPGDLDVLPHSCRTADSCWPEKALPPKGQKAHCKTVYSLTATSKLYLWLTFHNRCLFSLYFPEIVPKQMPIAFLCQEHIFTNCKGLRRKHWLLGMLPKRGNLGLVHSAFLEGRWNESQRVLGCACQAKSPVVWNF